jgi:hypothetical protein
LGYHGKQGVPMKQNFPIIKDFIKNLLKISTLATAQNRAKVFCIYRVCPSEGNYMVINQLRVEVIFL